MFIEIENENGHPLVLNTEFIIRMEESHNNKPRIIMTYEGGGEEHIIVGNMTFKKLSSLLTRGNYGRGEVGHGRSKTKNA